MTDSTSSGGPITEVREGMRVVDVDGEEVGGVEEIRMSDPGAVTAEGQGSGGTGGLLGHLAAGLGGDGGLPEQEQERLARLGYVRVDATGVFSGDRYVASDQIAEVVADTVHLSVRSDSLLG